jgi:preprotein translocase subunit SecD
LTAANLAVTPNSGPQGYSSNSVNPDSQYEAYPSTSVDKPNYATSTVLLPGINGACDGSAELRYVLGPAQMTGLHPSGSAQATQNQTGAWEVDYSLAGSAGSALWDKVAQENFHQFLGIELDGKVYSAPIIQPTQSASPPSTARVRSRGNMTAVRRAESGAGHELRCPAGRLKELTTSETVSATLGHSALVAGLGAGIVGLALVLLYVLFYYRGLGLVVISGLVLTALMLWAIISALGHTSWRRASTSRASRASSCPSVSPSTRTSSISND